jgi:hypothetical protein
VIEIATGATAERTAMINDARESERGYERIEGLDGPDWLSIVREWLAQARVHRGRNEAEVV